MAEISAVGVPSILVPKTYTAENHQEYNARAFEKKGASILVLEKDIKGELLSDTIYSVIKDKKVLSIMAKKSKELGIVDASERIFDIIKTITNE